MNAYLYLGLPISLLLGGCGGTLERIATPEVIAATKLSTTTGCLSPDGRALVLEDGTALRVADGEALFSGEGGVVYCDEAGVVVGLRDRSQDSVVLEVRVLDYETGAPVFEAARFSLPECAHMGSIHYRAGPTSEDIGLSWQVISYWTGGYPPSPEEEEDAHCDERGGVTIDRDTGRAHAGRFVEWDVPEDPSRGSGPIPAADGIAIVEDIHYIEPCRPSQEPVGSTVSAVRGEETLWTRVVPSPQIGADCVP